MASERVVVVGGGLAGLTAACECLERLCPVTILDKQPHMGGNSSKATCGIAAPGSTLQEKADVQDDGSDLAAPWATAAAKDVDWLVSMLGVESELVLHKTPGHNKMRTLSTKKYFPGMVVSYSAIQTLQKFAESKPDMLQIITEAEVTKLVVTGGKVAGVEYAKGGQTHSLSGPVILATGGFAGDMSKSSMLAKYRPDLLQQPTTNDERANGSGIKLAMAVGAAPSRLDEVSLFPTAMSLPGQETGGLKFVAADTLCGAGGMLLDATGKRFCDEMADSNARVQAMNTAKGPFYLVLPKQKSSSVEWLCKFYTDKKVMTQMNDSQLAGIFGAGSLKSTVGAGPFFVATVSSAIYSCAGGVSVSSGQEVLQSDGAGVSNLFAAGEVASAPCDFKTWSVSGMPLLYCIQSGRAAGKAAAKALMQVDAVSTPLKEVMKMETIPAPTPKEKSLDEMTKEELIAKVKELQANPGAAVVAAAPSAPAAEAGPASITLAEVAKHNKRDDAWIALNGQALNVTRWIDKHPGGAEAIMAYIGTDASDEWNTIHKPHFIEQYKDNYDILGPIGTGGPAPVANGAGGGGDSGISAAEVAKHNTKADAWITVNGNVYDVTKWITVHPGGAEAIVAFLGADASDEWNTIHKPGMIEKNMDRADGCGPVLKGPVSGGGGGGGPIATDDGPQEKPRPEGNGGIPGWPGAVVYTGYAIVINLVATIFFTGNFKFTNERQGTIKSAVMLLTFTVVHVAGNSYDFWLGGATQANGESYFFERQQAMAGKLFEVIGAGPAEIYIALAFMLHVSVALKRSWDISMNYCIHTGKWNMLLSGLFVLGFLIKHLQDFKFYDGYDFTVIHPPGFPFVNVPGAMSGSLWTDETAPAKVVKDVYSHQCEVFKNPFNLAFYLISVVVFVCHMVWGWNKVHMVDALQIPTDHTEKVKWIGYVLAVSIGMLYASVAVGTYVYPQFDVEHVARDAQVS